jgi:hypothetical protein
MNVRVQKAGVGDVKGGLRVQRLLGPMKGGWLRFLNGGSRGEWLVDISQQKWG